MAGHETLNASRRRCQTRTAAAALRRCSLLPSEGRLRDVVICHCSGASLFWQEEDEPQVTAIAARTLDPPTGCVLGLP